MNDMETTGTPQLEQAATGTAQSGVEAPRPGHPVDWQDTCTRTDLERRGWTWNDIETHLGVQDEVEGDPWRAYGPGLRVWALSRVAWAEDHDPDLAARVALAETQTQAC